MYAKNLLETDQSKSCIKCGTELKWGGFAHNQDACWDCFKKDVINIIGIIRCSGDERSDKYINILKHLVGVAAEIHGYEY